MQICPYCNGAHLGVTCPRIKKIEFMENGQVKSIEFKDTPHPNKPFRDMQESQLVQIDLLEQR